MSSMANRNASQGPSSGANNPTGSSNPAGSAAPESRKKRNAADRDSPFEEPPSSKKTRKNAVPKPKPFQLKPKQIPEEFSGTKGRCGSLELMQRFTQRYVPGFLATLEQRLRNESSEHIGVMQMVKFITSGAHENAAKGCNIASAILGIGEPFLIAIIHELVFIQTFRVVAAGFAYKNLLPTPSGVNNNTLLVDIYHNFLYCYMRQKAKTGTGRLLKNREDNNTSRCCKTLAGDRLRFTLLDKQPARVITMVKPQRAHSDGEGGRVHWINNKGSPGPRSDSAGSFLRGLDPRRKKLKSGKARSGKKEERKHRAEDQAVTSEMSYQIPEITTMDWFNPEYFNELPVATRFEYRKYGVALPLLQFHGNKDWKTMDDVTFMTAYGNNVLAQYDIPTQEEMDVA
ncbi:hypothetical protein C8R43DRAFT_1141951 [Mycena crocata]|nr:hypothetical protein C8R43DRAFT_1141951 [Mycena crocata]